MEFIDKQIAPPKSWERFEDLIRALFSKIWQDPLTQKNGRKGQKQSGVDIFGCLHGDPGRVFAVQCKGKELNYGARATTREFDVELAMAEKFTPVLAHWTFSTTAPVDEALQRHAREVSAQRVKDGRFPVAAIGWDAIQELLAGYSELIEQFYPEHSRDLPQILSAIRALPTAAELQTIKQALLALPSATPSTSVRSDWSEVRFETARDLGPALMGRPLGPADVAACPTLPEAAELVADLDRADYARLAGVAGAGKSICVLQAASLFHDRGWRVLRLDDPTVERVPEFEPDTPSLLIVDDAHLARPAFLRMLEERASATLRVLSAHTSVQGRQMMPGTIQLDAKRAVRVIADGLRATPEATFSVVRRADDRIGDRPGDEHLEQRLDHAAATAEFPWQFCFILGGGWRRAKTLAGSARAAGADLVLAAAAVRQLAMRDARCPPEALADIVGTSDRFGDFRKAIDWLVAQRLLLTGDDLRSPHQRFASVLLMEILDGQTEDGCQAIAGVMRRYLEDAATPLGGVAALLSEIALGGDFGRWTRLIRPEWLDLAIKRCWSCQTAQDIREACWVFAELGRYDAEERAGFSSHIEVLRDWVRATPEGACYSIGRVVGLVHAADEALGRAIANHVDPGVLAVAVSTAEPVHACEIAHLMRALRVVENKEWKKSYLDQIDRPRLFWLVSHWPTDAWLSSVSELCKHYVFFEPEFGFQLIERLIPAISERLREDPQGSFHEIDDIASDALRLFDPLGVYVGKLAANRRMKQVGRKICACWKPSELASKLSLSTPRNVQAAAGVLSFARAAAPRLFEETVSALDWDVIDRQIGNGWVEGIGDARMLLGVAYALKSARPAIRKMIARNEPRFAAMSAHLAAIAPETAFRHIDRGGRVQLTHFQHVEWQLGALVLCEFIEKRRDLMPVLLRPHLSTMAAALSQPSPSWYREALSFLRVMLAAAPILLDEMLGLVEVEKAAQGWRNALTGRDAGGVRTKNMEARQVVSLLVELAISRNDSVGDLARKLRRDFRKASTPHGEASEPIKLPEDGDIADDDD